MTSIPAAHFDALYACDADPWGFASSPYEAEKYAATIAGLDRPRFAEAVEIGCSIGVLTAKLATRCDRLLGVDFAAAALDHARARCAEWPHVRFEQRHVPDEWPGGLFDLIVLSELLYFLDAPDIEATVARVVSSLQGAGGRVLLVNYLGETGTPLSGEKAAERFIAAASLTRLAMQRTDHWRLDLLGSD